MVATISLQQCAPVARLDWAIHRWSSRRVAGVDIHESGLPFGSVHWYPAELLAGREHGRIRWRRTHRKVLDRPLHRCQKQPVALLLSRRWQLLVGRSSGRSTELRARRKIASMRD